VSSKLDGERVLCVTLDESLYVIPRSFDRVDVFSTQMASGYVLDVEKVNDVFVVLDVIADPSGVVRWLSLRERLSKFRLRYDKVRWDIQYYSEVSRVRDYTNKHNLYYKNDGLVFQSRSAPYYYGFNPRMYKWKPKGDTIDLIGDVWEGKRCLSALNADGSLYPLEECDSSYEIGAIYELEVLDTGMLRYVRRRQDKLMPNSLSIIAKIRISVQYQLTEQELIKECCRCDRVSTHYNKILNDAIGGAKAVARYVRDQIQEFSVRYSCPTCDTGVLFGDDLNCWICTQNLKGNIINKNKKNVKRSFDTYNEDDDDGGGYCTQDELRFELGYDANVNKYVRKKRESDDDSGQDSRDEDLEEIDDLLVDMNFIDN